MVAYEASPLLMPGVDGPGVKAFRRGTHRLVTPAETLQRVGRFMGAMGITRIANVTGLDRIGIPVAVACRPNSRSLAVAQGKGLELEAAKASALMESVEAYHAERITLPLVLGSYDDLRHTHRVVDVTQLPMVQHSLFHPHLALLWTEGYDLLQQETAWVPYEMVNANYTLPYPAGSGCFQATSNGLASGNHLLEAVTQGICEVVERDASTLWHLSREETRGRGRIDLDTIDDTVCRELLEKHDRAGVDAAVWEMTSDVGIPAFRCMIAERAESPLHLHYTVHGMGCHPSRAVALARALTEAAQGRLTYIAGSRDDLFRESYDEARNPDTTQRRRALLEMEGPLRSFHQGPNWEGQTFQEDVGWESACLRRAGIERVVVVNLTRPEFQVPVVRVVIPGLEGVYLPSEYAPGSRGRAWLKENQD